MTLTNRVSQVMRILLTSASPTIAPIVSDGLRLRRLAMAVLWPARRSQAADAAQAAVPCSPASWRIFLMTERCATALHAELQRMGLLDQFDAAVRAVLKELQAEELKHMLSARAQLREIEDIAVQTGTAVIVLKGAVPVLSGAQLIDLSDIDILPADGRAELFACELDKRGYTFDETTMPSDEHLNARQRAGMLDVEVHRNLGDIAPLQLDVARARARPVSAQTALLRLSPADQLCHLITHLGTKHFDRRGAIRDQLLIRSAANECSAEELATVYRYVRAHPAAVVLETVLGAALDTAARAADPFRRLSAARYAAAATLLAKGQMPPLYVAQPIKNFTASLAVDYRKYFTYWRNINIPAPVVAGRLQHGPRTGHALLVVLRVLRLACLTPPAALLAVRSALVSRSSHHSLVSEPL